MIRFIVLASLALAFLLGCTLPSCLNPNMPPPAPITRAPSLTPTDFVHAPTNTPTPTFTETISPTLTKVPPTETATVTPTLTPSVTPTETRISTTIPGRPKTLPKTGTTLPDYHYVVLLGFWLLVVGGTFFIEAQRKPH